MSGCNHMADWQRCTEPRCRQAIATGRASAFLEAAVLMDQISFQEHAKDFRELAEAEQREARDRYDWG